MVGLDIIPCRIIKMVREVFFFFFSNFPPDFIRLEFLFFVYLVGFFFDQFCDANRKFYRILLGTT